MKSDIDIKNIYRVSKSEKTVYVDVAIDFLREIYNEWDFSPLAHRDLDDDLFDYLEECALEVPKKYKLVIVFHIPQKIYNEQKQNKSIIGYRNYFKYQHRKLKKKKSTTIKQMVFYGSLGLCMIAGVTFFESDVENNMILKFISEGFYIGGWVLFWELFSILFFQMRELREKDFVLNRLMNSDIIYETR